jgi:hypothetical protein
MDTATLTPLFESLIAHLAPADARRIPALVGQLVEARTRALSSLDRSNQLGARARKSLDRFLGRRPEYTAWQAAHRRVSAAEEQARELRHALAGQGDKRRALLAAGDGRGLAALGRKVGALQRQLAKLDAALAGLRQERDQCAVALDQRDDPLPQVTPPEQVKAEIREAEQAAGQWDADAATMHAAAQQLASACPMIPEKWRRLGEANARGPVPDDKGNPAVVAELGAFRDFVAGRFGSPPGPAPRTTGRGGAAPPPPRRLVFDDDTLTVTLDGKPHKVDGPKAYRVFKVIVGRDDPAITKQQIRARVKGVNGQKTISALIKTLPPALKSAVKWGTRGYFHELPPPPPESQELDHN